MKINAIKMIRRYMPAYWVALVAVILLNALVIFPANVKAGPLPGSKSSDMKLYKSGRIYQSYGTFSCGRVYYYVYRSVYSGQNHWIGKVWSDKPCWFSEIRYHRTSFLIDKGDLPGFPNCGNDPYCNLPVNGQTWRYKSSDNFNNGDAIGAKPSTMSEWVALPTTSVPHGSWRTTFWGTLNPIYVHFESGYGYCRNWDDMRTGIGSENGHGGYMRILVVYDDYNCWWGSMDGAGKANIYLDKYRPI
jgi:hypothetical protein